MQSYLFKRFKEFKSILDEIKLRRTFNKVVLTVEKEKETDK